MTQVVEPWAEARARTTHQGSERLLGGKGSRAEKLPHISAQLSITIPRRLPEYVNIAKRRLVTTATTATTTTEASYYCDRELNVERPSQANYIGTEAP